MLNAFENVELPLLLTKLSKKERREHVNTALNIVGLSDRMFHYPRQLSGGQEQRVAIARAIVTDPTLLVADEPTGDLDARNAEETLDLLQRLNSRFSARPSCWLPMIRKAARAPLGACCTSRKGCWSRWLCPGWKLSLRGRNDVKFSSLVLLISFEQKFEPY